MALTPEQFNKLATKEDLENFYTKNEMDKKFDQLLTAIDGLTKIVADFQAEIAANQAAHDLFEYRISKLEGKEMIVRDEDERYSK